ncbi:hypothetical protein [Maribacter hydrothermalis]|nr:hypothetical protein [Maribacter hydrothermalis]
MKNLNKVIVCFQLVIVGVACTKSDANNCITCSVDGVEICDEGQQQVGIYIQGDLTGELLDLPSNVTFNEAAQAFCEELEKEFDATGDCYECSGPNVTTFPVCKEGDGITVSGTVIDDFEGESLETVISILEENPTDEEVFRDLACQRN